MTDADPAAGPLAGLRVAITRAAEQSRELTEGLESLGATVVSVPSIHITDPADGGAALARAVERLHDYEWLVITSPNGARRFCEALGDRDVPESTKVAAIGPGTADQLAQGHVKVVLVPSRHVAESLLASFPDPADPDPATSHTMTTPTHRVLIARAQTARDVLPEGLTERGWQVDVVATYETVVAPVGAPQVEALRGCDIVTFASASALRNLLEQVEPSEIPSLVVTIGPIASAEAARRGLKVAAEADPHTVEGLIEATVQAATARTATAQAATLRAQTEHS